MRELIGPRFDPAAIDPSYTERVHYFRCNGRRRRRWLTFLCEKQNNRCCWCGVQMQRTEHTNTRASIEHVIALAIGGTNDISNLAAACEGCNNKRGHRSLPPQWRETIWSKE